jgi:hypothetical protein
LNILGGIAKLQKANLASSFLSVRLYGTTRLPLKTFSGDFIFEYFSKSVGKIQVSLNYDKNNEYFT